MTNKKTNRCILVILFDENFPSGFLAAAGEQDTSQLQNR